METDEQFENQTIMREFDKEQVLGDIRHSKLKKMYQAI